MLDDELLEKYGEFYCSRYVAKNQPWILQIPFGEWVERQLLVSKAKPVAFIPEEQGYSWELYTEKELPLSEIA